MDNSSQPIIATRTANAGRVCDQFVTWVSLNPVSLDFRNQGVGKAMTTVQGVFVDNSNGPVVHIQVQGTATSLTIQPGQQGSYPIFMTGQSVITITPQATGGSTSFTFTDWPLSVSQWDAATLAQTTTDTTLTAVAAGPVGSRYLNVTDASAVAELASLLSKLSGTLITSRSKSTGTNHSVNQPATSALGILLFTVAANTNRLAIDVQNQSVNDIYLVRQDGSIYVCQASAVAGSQGVSWHSETYSGSLLVYGTSGSQVAISED